MVDIENAIEKVKEKYGLDIHLKTQQREIIFNLLAGKDFWIITDWIWKINDIYPCAADIGRAGKGRAAWHTSLVISPLRALMADQVEFLKHHNIKAAALTEETKLRDIREGRFSVVFASPEAATLTKWRNVVKNVQREKIHLLVFDEAHCISSWGLDFRPAYRHVIIIQSIIEKPNLVLTATATKKIQEDIYEILGFKGEKTKVVASLPDRPNLFLDFKESTEKFETELKWILDHINSENDQKKILIYVRSINLCFKIYLWIVSQIKENFLFMSCHHCATGELRCFTPTQIWKARTESWMTF